MIIFFNQVFNSSLGCISFDLFSSCSDLSVKWLCTPELTWLIGILLPFFGSMKTSPWFVQLLAKNTIFTIRFKILKLDFFICRLRGWSSSFFDFFSRFLFFRESYLFSWMKACFLTIFLSRKRDFLLFPLKSFF